jgi:hypothetical protein
LLITLRTKFALPYDNSTIPTEILTFPLITHQVSALTLWTNALNWIDKLLHFRLLSDTIKDIVFLINVLATLFMLGDLIVSLFRIASEKLAFHCNAIETCLVEEVDIGSFGAVTISTFDIYCFSFLSSKFCVNMIAVSAGTSR